MAGDVVVVSATEDVLAGRKRVTMLAESWRPRQMSASVPRAVKGAAVEYEDLR
jgi:hypothetical protein